MRRVYFSFVPLDTDRPGGPWWLRDLPDSDVDDFVRAITPSATGLRISDKCGVYDPHRITPPEDAEVIK